MLYHTGQTLSLLITCITTFIIAHLVSWRQHCKVHFKFNPTACLTILSVNETVVSTVEN